MVLSTRPSSHPAVRDIDRAWAERLEAEAARFERSERRSALRRGGVCLVIAAGVVALGLLGFSYETDTRLGLVYHVRSPGWVTVNVLR